MKTYFKASSTKLNINVSLKQKLLTFGDNKYSMCENNNQTDVHCACALCTSFFDLNKVFFMLYRENK